MKAPNLYKVPKNVWGKWGKPARLVFNEVYHIMKTDNGGCLYPEQWAKLGALNIRTIAWNTAWVAAQSCQTANEETWREVELSLEKQLSAYEKQ